MITLSKESATGGYLQSKRFQSKSFFHWIKKMDICDFLNESLRTWGLP